MILAYRVLTALIYPFLIVFIYLRKIIKKEDQIRFKEKIFTSYFNVKRELNSQLIWIHAASLGELKSIIPIIEELNANKNNLEFLVTTSTLSSSNLAINEFSKFKNIQHRFFPLDVSFLIKNFIQLWKPYRIFLVDSEIWPNLITQVDKSKIPIALINARLTNKSFKRWMRFPKTAKKIFNTFDLCLSSSFETKKMLENLIEKNLFFKGNLKLINQINKSSITNINEKFLLKNKFWIAASTHEEEESFCLKVHSKLKMKIDKIVTIIAPRHIDRSLKIKSLAEKRKLKVQILNKGDLITKNKEIIIINSFGTLNDFFKYAKSTFIGKSIIKKLINDSGQNPIDAAKLNCKIYHGPYVKNFEEIYEILRKKNISKKIESVDQLSNYLLHDLESQALNSNRFFEIMNDLGQKTLSDTMQHINNFISNDHKKT